MSQGPLHLGGNCIQLLHRPVLELALHLPNVVDAEPGAHAVQGAGEVGHRAEHALLIVDSLTLERHPEVMGDVLAQGVREVACAHNVTHLIEIEPIVRLALVLNPQHARRRRSTAGAALASWSH